MENKRHYNGITMGVILAELDAENIHISTSGFYRLEKQLDFPRGTYTITSKGRKSWTYYTREQADIIKQKIKAKFNIT